MLFRCFVAFETWFLNRKFFVISLVYVIYQVYLPHGCGGECFCFFEKLRYLFNTASILVWAPTRKQHLLGIGNYNVYGFLVYGIKKCYLQKKVASKEKAFWENFFMTSKLYYIKLWGDIRFQRFPGVLSNQDNM